jgi:hypothetical protein
MSNTKPVRVIGVQHALKQLHKINPELRKQFTKRYKDITKPVVAQAKAAFPSDAPLSGMGRPHTRLGGWDGGLVRKGVIARINTRKGRSQEVAVFVIQQRTGWGSIFDIAGRSNASSQFVQNLMGKGYGGASRAMWPAYESNATAVQAAVIELVADVRDTVNRNLESNGN